MKNSLVKNLMPVWQKEDVRIFEGKLLASGVQLKELIDRASSFVVSVLKAYVRPPARVLVIAGKGNNGEDALMAASKLKILGYQVGVILYQRKTDTALKDFNFVAEIDDQAPDAVEKHLSKFRPDAVIDGMFGIGFRLPLPEKAAMLFRQVNSLPVFRLAVDLPSGVEANTGEADENAFKADATATFFAYKPAHFLPGSKELSGAVHLSFLGFAGEAGAFSPEKTIFKAVLVDKPVSPVRRPKTAHKKTSGVLLIAGSHEMPGAAYLAAKGAFSAGAGYVAVATDEKAVNRLSSMLPEAVYFPLNFENIDASFQRLKEYMGSFKSVVVGPGISRKPESLDLSLRIIKSLSEKKLPSVIDGDALFALATSPERFRLSSSVLTPHPGEAARFFKRSPSTMESAYEIARRYGSVCVYKASSTLITDGKQAIIFSDSFSNLATAGSGDVLAGVTAALLAQGLSPFQAAVESVAAQSLVSRKLLQSLKGAPITASEIAASVRIIFEGMCGDFDEG